MLLQRAAAILLTPGELQVPSLGHLVPLKAMQISTQPLGCDQQTGQRSRPLLLYCREKVGHSRACAYRNDGESPKPGQNGS